MRRTLQIRELAQSLERDRLQLQPHGAVKGGGDAKDYHRGLSEARRRQVFEKIRDLVSPMIPFVNLPDTHKSRCGDELTAEKMKECVWLRREAVARIEFLEWTAGGRLQNAKFIGLRDDKNPREVVKEGER